LLSFVAASPEAKGQATRWMSARKAKGAGFDAGGLEQKVFTVFWRFFLGAAQTSASFLHS